ncbi:hypothetical protein CH238_09900 [[Clostridium] leptum DSM 753]|uniref:Uncharacterized protein n=1 Tax=[Clostridium] leptum DSM 753 TaxID=428125 RepID=A0A855A446_9FIRM|nr:hypothetical protein CH238_09900 [[Clostridium] leptum DSM 753]RGU04377.1 hypothetical protein DWW99_02805 [[Clostridium] leptum]
MLTGKTFRREGGTFFASGKAAGRMRNNLLGGFLPMAVSLTGRRSDTGGFKASRPCGTRPHTGEQALKHRFRVFFDIPELSKSRLEK